MVYEKADSKRSMSMSAIHGLPTILFAGMRAFGSSSSIGRRKDAICSLSCAEKRYFCCRTSRRGHIFSFLIYRSSPEGEVGRRGEGEWQGRGPGGLIKRGRRAKDRRDRPPFSPPGALCAPFGGCRTCRRVVPFLCWPARAPSGQKSGQKPDH